MAYSYRGISAKRVLRLSVASVALVSSLLGHVATSSPAEAADATEATARGAVTTASPSTDVFEKRIQRRINAMRTAHGKHVLRSGARIDEIAERWLGQLARTDSFGHQSMDRVLDVSGGSYTGEILAMGVTTPREAVRLWMHSPTHRHVMLSSSPRRIGVAAELQAAGGWLIVVDFLRR